MLILYCLHFHPLPFIFMFSSVFFLFHLIFIKPGQAQLNFFLFVIIISYNSLTYISNNFSQAEGACFFHFFNVVRLCICTAWCVFFSFFVKHFHFQLQFSAATDYWSSVGLWAYSSESLSVLSLLLFSLSDTIKQKHISKPSERGIFLSFLFTPVCLVFTVCFYFLSMLPSRFALCVVQFIGLMFCSSTINLNVIN